MKPPLRELLERIRRLFRREPEPPFAMVGAPKKPRRPQGGASTPQPLD